jgi:orotate phosphoribosyltransferase
MDVEKRKFIEFLSGKGALKFGDFTLKSKRSSPYFINVGDLSTGGGLFLLADRFTSQL